MSVAVFFTRVDIDNDPILGYLKPSIILTGPILSNHHTTSPAVVLLLLLCLLTAVAIADPNAHPWTIPYSGRNIFLYMVSEP
jgi:hypothetical protein